jgi:hypothetical protein
LTQLLFTLKINKPLSNNLYVFFPSQIAKFQTKIKTTILLQPLKYELYNGNSKTILEKEMLLGTDSKEESTAILHTPATGHLLTDDRYLDSILNDTTV